MRALILVAASTIWFGCSGGASGNGGDIGVTLTTAGGATTVPSGGTLSVKANVTNSATMAVSWSLAGSTCPGGCGTITPTGTLDYATYAAPSNALAQFTVTVTATSDEDRSKRGSVTLTVQPRVCPASAGLLSGQYAFLLQGFDQASQVGIALVGSLTADACGIVTAGAADYYLGPSAAGSTTSLAGSYAVGTDQRGTLSLTAGAGTMHFAFALGGVGGGVASRGAITEMDANAGSGPVLSGTIWRQDPTAFALNKISGPYAFLLNGWNGSGPREIGGGTLTADAAGTFSGHGLDQKVMGTSEGVTTTGWTGGYGTPSSSGRAVVTAPALTGASGSAVMYVVASNHVLMMISDTTSVGRVLSGRMLAQAGPFSLSSLDGTCVTYQAANYDQPGYEGLNMAVLAIFTADGGGNLSAISLDESYGGNNYHAVSGIHYTYTVDAHGQATIFTAPSVPGGKWYLVDRNSALMLGFDYGASVGRILEQAAEPFSAASISGDYLVGQEPGAAFASFNRSGVATSTGSGALSTVLDVNRNGIVAAAQATSGTVTVGTNGRATDTDGNVIYVVSPTRFLRMNQGSFDPATWYPLIQIFDR
jgi:hypothetical protein